MPHTLRAITLDLDDTLWPIQPAIERAEAAVDAWFREHSPRTAARWPAPTLRALREQVAARHPELAHDYSTQRLKTFELALEMAGEDRGLAQAAFDAFFRARNTVDLYPEVPEALARISRRLPVAALTNGNADLDHIGLSSHFVFSLGAREHGRAKPEPGIFHAACQRLGCAPGEVLHVGDHPVMDVLGAARAGLRAGWLNRERAPWREDGGRPHHVFHDLAALADWLDGGGTLPE